MTCLNAHCSIFIICQNKDEPCPANTARTVIVHNGYAAMARTEQAMRNAAIEFRGDFG